MNTIENMTGEMLDWIEPMIPGNDRDPMKTTIKLAEEVAELIHALYIGDGSVGEECADILILLLDVAHLNGIDLGQEFTRKMAINRSRNWREEKGALKHE